MKDNNCSNPVNASHQDCLDCSSKCDCRREIPSRLACLTMMVIMFSAAVAWFYLIYKSLEWLSEYAIKLFA